MDLSGALGLSDRELVSFVGAGGKKTAMGRLVEESDDRGLSVGYTTTVKTPPPPALPLVLADPGDLDTELADAGPRVAFASRRIPDPDRADEKVAGFDPATVDRIFASGRFDRLVVKADGARRREFKAPGPGEPPIPRQSTTVVVVASVRAVGDPPAAETIHRGERVADLAGIALDEPLTPDAVGRVIAHPEGGLKNVPPDARVVLLVNKADDPSDRDRARGVVESALGETDRIDRGVVSSLDRGRIDVIEGSGESGCQ